MFQFYVLGGIPDNPLVFNTILEWQNWYESNVLSKYRDDKMSLPRDGNNPIEIHEELMDMGYDGIIIKGREVVNFMPDDVRFFENEYELQEYYKYIKEV